MPVQMHKITYFPENCKKVGSGHPKHRHLLFGLNSLFKKSSVNSLSASDEFCRLLIIFTKKFGVLDPDQARQYVWPNFDPNPLIL